MEELMVVGRCLHMWEKVVLPVWRQKPPTAWTLVQNGAHENHLGGPRDRTKDLTLMEIQCDRILGIRSLFSWIIMLVWQT